VFFSNRQVGPQAKRRRRGSRERTPARDIAASELEGPLFNFDPRLAFLSVVLSLSILNIADKFLFR
jgi:hypothetical protein